jgi:hypothetical protein
VFFHPSQRVLEEKFNFCFDTDALMPSVLILNGGPCSDRDYLSDAVIARATRGATVVVLDKTGHPAELVAGMITEACGPTGPSSYSPPAAVEAVGGEEADDTSSKLTLPSGTPLSNFLLFDTPTVPIEYVVTKLTARLSQAKSSNGSELGSGEADILRLQHGWNFIVIFIANAKRHQMIANILMILLTGTSLLTTGIAVVLSARKSMSDEDKGWTQPGWSWVEEHVHLIALASAVLPLLSGFFLSMNTTFNPSYKAARFRTAAAEVACELYMYRAAVGDYAPLDLNFLMKMAKQTKHGSKFSPQPNAAGAETTDTEQSASGDNKDNKGQDGTEAMPQTYQMQPREVLGKRLSEIYGSVMGSDMTTDAIGSHTTDDVKLVMANLYHKKRQEQKRGDYSEPPQQNGYRMLCGSMPEVHPAGRAFGPLLGSTDAVISDGGFQDADEDADDGLSVISAEEYFRWRLKPHIDMLTKKAHWCMIKLRIMQVTIFLTTTATGILGLMEANTWMPIAVSVYTALNNMLEYTQLSARLRQTNATATALKHIQILFESLTMVERRYPQTKQDLVFACEQVICREEPNFVSSTTDPRSRKKGNKKDAQSSDENEVEA